MSGRDDVVSITVERTGGFGGIRRQVGSVDRATLEPGEGAQLQQLIDDVGFFALPETLADPSAPGADTFQYVVTAETADGRRHTVRESENGRLQLLIDFVRAQAEREPNGGDVT